MLTEDYLIRMINLAIAAMLRIMRLRKDGDFTAALQLIDLTLEQLVGLRANLIKHLEDERLYAILTRADRLDTQRLALIADLLKEEGDILAAMDQPAESRDRRLRALKYFLEASFHENEIDPLELNEKIAALVEVLDAASLEADVLWPLSGYYEDGGMYARAERILLQLAQRPDLRSELQPELAAFYERMVEKSPAELLGGGMDPAHAREGLARWKGKNLDGGVR